MYDKVRALAKKYGISIPELEKKLRLGNGTLSKWNSSSPTLNNLKKVADFFGVSIEYFLEDEKVEA